MTIRPEPFSPSLEIVRLSKSELVNWVTELDSSNLSENPLLAHMMYDVQFKEWKKLESRSVMFHHLTYETSEQWIRANCPWVIDGLIAMKRVEVLSDPRKLQALCHLIHRVIESNYLNRKQS